GLLPQNSDPGRGRPHPVRRADPDPEGKEEESLHLLPAKRVHIFREREATCPVPIGHGPSEGLRRRLERSRPDEAVSLAPNPTVRLNRNSPAFHPTKPT